MIDWQKHIVSVLIHGLKDKTITPQTVRSELLIIFPECEEEINELQDDGTLKTDRFSGVYSPGSNSYEVFFTDDDFEIDEFALLGEEEGNGSYCCGKRMVLAPSEIVYECLNCGAWEWTSC